MPAGFRGLEVSAPDFWAPLVAARAVPAGPRRQRGQGRRGRGGAAQARRVDGERPRAVVRVGFEPADPHRRRSPGRAPHPAAETRHAPATDGGRCDLHAVVLFVRTDPGDRLRQRRQPAARSCGGTSARDRHPAVARRATPPHHPPADDRELAARAGRGRRRLPGLARRRSKAAVYWAMRTTPVDLGDININVPGGRLARRRLPGHRGDRRDGVLRIDAGAAGHPDRAGADAARRTGEGRASRPRPQCADRHPGLRVGAVVDLRGDFPAQRDRVIAIRSGSSHRGHRDYRHHQ